MIGFFHAKNQAENKDFQFNNNKSSELLDNVDFINDLLYICITNRNKGGSKCPNLNFMRN